MSTDNSTTTTDPSTTTTFTDLNKFQRDVLFAARAFEDDEGSPPIGLEIMTVLEEDLGYDEVHHGRLYPNLNELRDEGLIEKTEADKRSFHYHVTDAGIAMLDQRVQRLASCCGMPIPARGNGGGD